jgi:hypothetical protein
VADFTARRPIFKPRSGRVGFVVDKVALGQVLSEYFGFHCQFSFHRLFHTHHLPSGAGAIGQTMADVPSGFKSHSTQEIEKEIGIFLDVTPFQRILLLPSSRWQSRPKPGVECMTRIYSSVSNPSHYACKQKSFSMVSALRNSYLTRNGHTSVSLCVPVYILSQIIFCDYEEFYVSTAMRIQITVCSEDLTDYSLRYKQLRITPNPNANSCVWSVSRKSPNSFEASSA